MSYSQLLEELNKFDRCYQTSNTKNFTHTSYVDNSNHFYWSAPVHRRHDDDDCDECNKRCCRLWTGLAILATSLIIVAVAAYDDFILYVRSNVTTEINMLNNQTLKHYYREWFDAFYYRVRTKFVMKVLVLVSVPIILIGIDSIALVIGFAILVVAAMYLLWVNLTDDLSSEKNKFAQLKTYVNSQNYVQVEGL